MNCLQNCYINKRRKNNNNSLIQNHPPKIDINNNTDNSSNVSIYENHAHVVIGSKTYYMLKIFEKIGNKGLFI